MESYPLQWPVGWPRTKNPERSRFGSGYNNKPTISAATKFLLEELRRFGVDSVVISTNLKYKQDNTPYSNQKEPVDKGVSIYFMYKKEQMSIACDSFTNIGCNIYAIAKTIEALRGIARWGCSELMNRAFSGFKQLSAHVAKRTWYEVFSFTPGAVYSIDDIKSRYKQLAMKKHPDKGGSNIEFQELTEAYNDALNHVQ